MHEAVILSLFQDGHRLVIGDIVAAVGLYQVFGHVAHADTPVAVVIGTSLFEFLAAISATADADRQMTLVAFEPVGNMLNVSRLVFHGDGFLYRNDVHADTGTTHRNHWGDLLQWQERHPFEKHGQFRMLVHQFHVHIGVFGTSRHEHRHPVDAGLALKRGAGDRTLFGVFVTVVVFQHAEER